MTQVEDVGARAPRLQEAVDPRVQRPTSGAQQQVIQRALNGLSARLDSPAHRGAGLGVERHALNRNPCGIVFRQRATAPGKADERRVNAGRAHLLDDPDVGSDDNPLENILGKVFRPALEQLQDLGAGPGLHHQVTRRGVHQHVQQGVELLGILIGIGPRCFTLRAPPLDHVGGHGPGGAGKADQGALGLQYGAHPAQRLADIGELGGRAFNGVAQSLHRRQGAQPRALTGFEPDLLAQGLGDQQDVGEDDGGVHREPPHGLQGRLGGHFRVEAEGDEIRRPGSQLPVFGQGPPGLAHEPDRRAVQGLAGQGAQQAGRRLAHGRLKARPRSRLKSLPKSLALPSILKSPE